MAHADAYPPPERDARGTWLIRRHADVAQALRDTRLVPQGQLGGDPQAHEVVRAAVRQGLSAERLARWEAELAALARARLDTLCDGATVELVEAFARPWSEAAAALVTGLAADEASACLPLAQGLYLAAAQARDGQPDAAAGDAAVGLARLLGERPRPEEAVADVQTFVALSQTLPALLAGAWHALLQDPAALTRLLAQPQELVGYLPELLRLGSPAQVVFRIAAEALEIAGASLSRGESVDLMLAMANRDPQRFPEPLTMDPARTASAQLGLGAGTHHCAGAALVRLALTVATRALLQRCRAVAAADAPPVAMPWRGGYALRSPAQLWVHLRR